MIALPSIGDAMPTFIIARPFKHRGELLNPGQSIEVPADVAPKLLVGGFISPNTPATFDELYQMLGRALSEINRAGRSWDGWMKSFSEPQKQALRAVEKKIDLACLTLDRPGLVEALAEYKRLTLNEKKTHI